MALVDVHGFQLPQQKRDRERARLQLHATSRVQDFTETVDAVLERQKFAQIQEQERAQNQIENERTRFAEHVAPKLAAVANIFGRRDTERQQLQVHAQDTFAQYQGNVDAERQQLRDHAQTKILDFWDENQQVDPNATLGMLQGTAQVNTNAIAGPESRFLTTAAQGGFMTPLARPEQIEGVVGQIPGARQTGIAEEVGRVVSPLTTGGGIFTAGLAPKATLAGTAGAGVLGEVGYGLEEAGVDERLQTPVGSIGPRSAGELVGGVYSGGRLPGMRAAGNIIDTEVTARVPALRGRYLREHNVPPVSGGAVQPMTSLPSYGVAVSAPVDEKIGTTVLRRFEGESRASADQLEAHIADIRKQAQASGLRLTDEATPEMEQLIDAIETRTIQSLPPNAQATAQSLRDVLDSTEQMLLAANPELKGRFMEDYFPHLFKRRPGVTGPGGMGGPSRNAAFLKTRRESGTLMEVLQRRPDLELVTNDPSKVVQLHAIEAIKYDSGQKLLARLQEAGVALPKSQAPSEWVVPDAPIFRGNQMMRLRAAGDSTAEEVAARFRAKAQQLEEGAVSLDQLSPDEIIAGRAVKEDLAVPPELASQFNNYFGQSAFSTNTVLGALRATSATAKLIKTAGGLQQNFDLSLRTAANAIGHGELPPVPSIAKSWLRGFAPGFDESLRRAESANPDVQALVRNGIQTNGGLDIIEKEVSQMLAEPSFLARINGPTPVKWVRNAAEYFLSGFYQRAHRGFILDNGMRLLKGYKGKMPLEEAAARAARETNEQMSSIARWQTVFRDPTTRDIMRTVFFSPNETEAWWRNAFGLARKSRMANATRFWAGLTVQAVAWANIINVISTGKPLPSDRYNPFSGEKNELGIPLSYNTQFLRPNLPFKGPLGREEYLDILGQADTPLRWTIDPIFGTKSRLSGPASVALQAAPLVSGQQLRDFSGQPVGLSDAPEYLASQIAPLPVQPFLEERSRIGTAGAGIQSGGFNVSGEPLRALLKRRFEEITGQPFSEDTGYTEAQTIPELKPILDEINARALQFESPGAVAKQERTGFLADQEQQLQLPSLARAVDKNLPGAGVAFRDAFRDLQTTGAIAAARDFFGVDPREVQTPEGKAFREWSDLDPSQYRDPETFQIDWGAWQSKRDELKSALPERLRTYLDSRMTSQDADVKAQEPRYRDALGEYRSYAQIPKYNGLSAEDGHAVDDITRSVLYARLSTGQPTELSAWDAFHAIRDKFDPNLASWYEKNMLSKPDLKRSGLGGGLGSSSDRHKPKKVSPQSPERDEYLLDHPDVLYFGFVSPSQLPLELRATLPDYILSGGVDPSTALPELAETTTTRR